HSFTARSLPDEASVRPSGLMRSPRKALLCPDTSLVNFPVAASHTLMVPLVQPVARTLPSFDQAAEQISPGWALAADQPASSTRRAWRSPARWRAPPPVYSTWPSLLKTRPAVQVRWPCSSIRSRAVATSQTIASPNDAMTPPTLTSVLLSGLKAHARVW